MSSLGKRARDDSHSSLSYSESLRQGSVTEEEKEKLNDNQIAEIRNLDQEKVQGLTFDYSAPDYYAAQYKLATEFVRNPLATKTPQFPHDLELTEAMKEFKNLVSNNPLNRRIPSEFFSSDFLSKFEEYSLRRDRAERGFEGRHYKQSNRNKF